MVNVMPKRSDDISGMVVGNWTAIEFSRMGTRRQCIWKFQCKCGNISEEYAYVIKRGGKKSCGCIKGKDITGMRFGRLVAIRNTWKQATVRKSYYWVCKCDCGNETEAILSNLMNGHTQSCGCYKLQRISETKKTHGMSGTPEYNRMKSRQHKEKYRGIDSEWTYPMEVEVKKYFDKCVVCGSCDDLEIDHVLPKSRGYGLKPGNVVILCHNHNCTGFKGNKEMGDLPQYARDKILSAAKSFENHWNELQAVVK